MSTVKVLFVSSEIYPWVKTGGLADVSSALPAALLRAGIDVRILVPGYRPVLAHIDNAPRIHQLDGGKAFGPMPVRNGPSIDGTPVYVLDLPTLYDRDGGPYQNAAGDDWPDNALRFEFAAPSYEAGSGNQFQTFLEGFDKRWSAWSMESKMVRACMQSHFSRVQLCVTDPMDTEK